MSENEKALLRLRLWQARCLRGRLSHLTMQNVGVSVDFGLTMFNVISSVLLLVVSALDVQSSVWRGGIIVFGAIAAASSLIQHVFEPRERAASHKQATNGYLRLFRDLEDLILAKNGQASPHEWANLRKRRDKLSEESPTIPNWAWRRLSINKRIAELEQKLGQETGQPHS